jgi:hypothetical protein
VTTDRSAPRPPLETLADGPPEVVSRSSFPQYAYGLLLAARLARALDLESISSLELGVAGGNGLLELERLAVELGYSVGVAVETYGFDLGSGMPPPVDHRDVPYSWKEGFFLMDETLLRSRLTAAHLVLGDIAETGRSFIDSATSPIGFISFDLDYHSSTVAAFDALLGGDADHYLPRVLCYFDDTVGPHEELHSEYTGELLAITEFNEANANRKISKINGLAAKLHPMVGPWIEGMYVLHLFDHDRYNAYTFPDGDRQFPLEAPG